MRYKDIAKLFSFYLYCLSFVLIIPILCAVYYDFIVDADIHPYPTSFESFLITLGICLAFAIFFHLTSKNASGRFYKKESLFLVFLVWASTTIVGAIPFLITKTLENPIDAYFESVSGFTTTGFSVVLPKKYDSMTGAEIPYEVKKPGTDQYYQFYGTIKEVENIFTGEKMIGFEAIAKPILFWRSFIQWLGGMGIIFVFMTILPSIQLGGRFLYEAESHPTLQSGASKVDITPRVKERSAYLWKIYLGITTLEILLLYFTNPEMSLFDAITVSFSTISTGGFSVHEASVGAYSSHPVTIWIIIVFMILGATNFGLYYHLITGKFKKIFNVELLLYSLVILVSVGLVFWKLMPSLKPNKAFTDGCFQTVSALTCTGFSTANYNVWPLACQGVMLIVMFVGGMTGSTSGGIKTSRHIAMFRSFKQKMLLMFKPDLVKTLKLGSVTMDQKAIANIFIFFWVLVVTSVIGIALVIFDGIDLESAIGLISSGINNVGLAFRMAGPGNTCAFLPVFSKIVTITWMLLGRLEFFAVLILLTPSFWKKT